MTEVTDGNTEREERTSKKEVRKTGENGWKSRRLKNPKITKEEPDDDDDFLDNLVTELGPDKRQPSYSKLEPGGFVTKGADRKTRLDQRQMRIVAVTGKPDEGQEEEMEQERLEWEADELTSQLKKVERAEAQAWEKEQRDKAKHYSQWITGGQFLKQPKAVTLVEAKKRKKSMKMGDTVSAEEDNDPDNILEGFHLQEESPHCINMTRADDYRAYLRQVVLEFEHLIKTGASDIRENYGKVIESMFWVVKANKQTILNRADPD